MDSIDLIPFGEIEETEDRSWSFELLRLLNSETIDENTAEKIVRTLSVLDDPRTIEPLTKILEDTNKSDFIRRTAAEILLSCYNSAPSSSQRQIWLNSNDEILKEFAIKNCDRSDGALLLSIAQETNNKFQATAISQLATGFDETPYIQARIVALDNQSAIVRQAAAESLCDDQPVAAEGRLIQAVDDSSEDVAICALQTLQYYCSQRAFLFLHEVSSRAARSEVFSTHADEAYRFIHESFQGSLDTPEGTSSDGIDRFTSWLAPVNHLLDMKIKFKKTTASSHSEPAGEIEKILTSWQRGTSMTVEKLTALFEQLDGHWDTNKEQFKTVNWEVFSEPDRQSIAKFLITHPDSWIRWAAVEPIVGWCDIPNLLRLMNDSVTSVRKQATYLSQFLRSDSRISTQLLEMIPFARGWHGREIIDSYVVHAESDKLNEDLLKLAFSEREEISIGCVKALANRKAVEQIKRLHPLLERQPIAWGLQTAVLEAFMQTDIETTIPDQFLKADDLYLQRHLAFKD